MKNWDLHGFTVKNGDVSMKQLGLSIKNDEWGCNSQNDALGIGNQT